MVDCDKEQQLERLRRRDGLSPGDAEVRLDAQWPLSRKRVLADRVIDNRGSSEDLLDQLNRCDPFSPGTIS